MYTKPRKSTVLLIIALLAAVALTSSACTFSGVRVSTTLPLIDIIINQDNINQLSSMGTFNIDCPYDRLLDEVSRIEIHNGFIRYLGTKAFADRSEVDGSFDVSLGAENDMLEARIVAVNIPGMNLSDREIVKANQELERVLSHLVTDSHGGVLFKEVVVKEGELGMKVQVNIDY